MRRSLVIVSVVLALAVAACGDKKAAPAASTNPPPTSASSLDAAVAAKPATPATPAAPAAKPAAITKAVRVEYKQRLSAGRKAAKAAQWPAAIRELEAALVAIPGDDRALAELSFAAMSAGDHDKARKAGRQAVRTATDPKIKAASLYNLGRVEETAAPAKAAALYRESLALRPNATVEKRLADLASRGSYTPPPPPCATPMPLAKICPCLNATVEDLAADGYACELEETDLADFQLATFAISDVGERDIMVVGKSDAGWSVVAILDSVYNPGAFGISEEWELMSATDERHGTRSIARFVSKKSRNDSDLGIDEVESETTTELLVCVRDNAGGPPTCPLAVQTDYEYTRDRLGLSTDDDMADVSDIRTKGLPINSATKLSVELGVDGVAKVRAVQGRPDPSVLGDKKVW